MKTAMQSSPQALIARGLGIVLPLLLLGVMIDFLYGIVVGWIRPVLDAMPGTVFQSEAGRLIAVILFSALLFFLVGALAATRTGARAGRRVELSFLSRLPLYNALRSLVAGFMGRKEAGAMKPVLVTIEDPGIQQFGFLLETHADGQSTIFLPDTPNPGSGATLIVTPDRVQELNVSARAVLRCLCSWGHGAEQLLSNAQVREIHGVNKREVSQTCK